jgi:hypothetical protein
MTILLHMLAASTLQRAAVATGPTTTTITEGGSLPTGNNTSGTAGYIDGSIGSISAGATSVSSVDILGIYASRSTDGKGVQVDTFIIAFNGDTTSSHPFTSVELLDVTGTPSLTPAGTTSVTYDSGAGETRYTWLNDYSSDFDGSGTQEVEWTT